MYVRERRDLDVGGRKICVVLAKSSSVSQCPEKKGVIRVKDYKQSLAMESDGSGGTKGTNTRLMMSCASLELRRTTDCVNQMLHSVHQHPSDSYVQNRRKSWTKIEVYRSRNDLALFAQIVQRFSPTFESSHLFIFFFTAFLGIQQYLFINKQVQHSN